MTTWTVNVEGGANTVSLAKFAGYNAYHATGVAAIEIPASNKGDAKKIARQFGRVLYVYE
jgi:hypothetical protein